MYLEIIPSITSSAPPPIDHNLKSRYNLLIRDNSLYVNSICGRSLENIYTNSGENGAEIPKKKIATKFLFI